MNLHQVTNPEYILLLSAIPAFMFLYLNWTVPHVKGYAGLLHRGTVIFGYEQANRYQVFDQDGQPVAQIAEVSSEALAGM